MLCAVAVFAFVLLVPIPISLKAPLSLQYTNSKRVFSNTHGQLAAIHVRPGQSVRAGQVLFELFDFEPLAQLNRLSTNKRLLEIELRKQKVLVDSKESAIVLESLQSINSKIADLKSQLEHFQIRAPVNGVVVEPVARKQVKSNKRTLSTWEGFANRPGKMWVASLKKARIC